MTSSSISSFHSFVSLFSFTLLQFFFPFIWTHCPLCLFATFSPSFMLCFFFSPATPLQLFYSCPHKYVFPLIPPPFLTLPHLFSRSSLNCPSPGFSVFCPFPNFSLSLSLIYHSLPILPASEKCMKSAIIA